MKGGVWRREIWRHSNDGGAKACLSAEISAGVIISMWLAARLISGARAAYVAGSNARRHARRAKKRNAHAARRMT